MATAELSMGKLAEMGKASGVNGQAQPVQPGKVNPTKRYQHKIDLLTRRWKQEQDISRALNVLVDKYDQLVRKQRAEIRELEKAVNRALDSRDLYCQRLKQRLENPPIVPDLTKGMK